MPGENLMIIIGIDEYHHPNYPNLSNAKFDAERLRDILSSKYNFIERDFLVDGEATREAIGEAIIEIITLLPDDNLIIFFAGHGELRQGALGYWVPTDGTDKHTSWCPNSELLDCVRHSPAQHILVISDCCFSGSMINQSRGNEIIYDHNQLDALGSRWLFTSGAMERVKDGQQGMGSPFGRSLIKFLEINNSPTFAASQLFDAVGQMVVAQGYPQKVQVGEVRCDRHMGGQMIFRLSASTNAKIVQAIENNFLDAAIQIDIPQFYISRTIAPFDVKTFKIFGVPINDSQNISLLEAVIQNRKIVLLGTAGSGKSVELKNLTRELAKTGTIDFIPIYKRLNHYVDETIEKLFHQALEKINEDKLVLILDGLDEVQPQNFRTIIRRLNSFSEEHPLVRIVISCRNNFYDLPADDFSGTISDYTVYVLNDISLNGIQKFVNSQHGIDVDTFTNEVYKNAYLDFASKPYFLEILIETFKKNSNLSIGRFQILEEALIDLYNESKGKYQTTVDYPAQTYVFSILGKIAFVMEIMAKNFISEQELTEVVSVEEFGRLKYFPLFKKNEDDGNWMFEHNNIQEFLASRMLAQLPNEKLLSLITIQSDLGSRLKPTWSNTVSFYISIAKDEKRDFLLNWLIENEPEALIRFESERVPEDVRITIFKQIFNDYNSKKIWLASNKFSDKDLAQFGNQQQIIDFLLAEINNTANTQLAVSNAVGVLRYYDLNKFGKEATENVHSSLVNLIADKRMDNYGAYQVMNTLSALQLNDTGTIDKVIRLFNDNDNQYIRSGLYILIGSSPHINQYAYVFFDGLDRERLLKTPSKRSDINLLDEQFTLEAGLRKINGASELKELFLILAELKKQAPQRLINIPDSENVVSDIIENLIRAYYQDKTVFNSAIEYYKIATHGYHNNLAIGIRRFFEETKTKYSALTAILLDKEFPTYELDIVLPPLLDSAVIDEFLQDYLADVFHQKEIEMVFEFLKWTNNPGLDASTIQKVITVAKQKDGIELNLTPQVNWKEKNKTRAQASFNLLFNKGALIHEAKNVFHVIEKKEIEKDDFGQLWRMNGFHNEINIPEVVTELLRNLLFDNRALTIELVLNWINSAEFDKFQIDRIYHYLNNADITLEVSKEQVEFLQEFSVNHPQLESQQIVWLFIRKFPIQLPENQWLDFTLYYDHSMDGELSTHGLIEQLAKKVDNSKIKQRIMENLSRKDINNLIWINNAAYALRSNLVEAYPAIHLFLKSASESEYKLAELLHLWYSITSDDDGLIEVIEHSTEFYFKWDALSLLKTSGTRNEYLQKHLYGILSSDASPFEEKSKAANYLIEIGDVEGFHFLADYILKERNPNREYWRLLGSLNKLSDINVMDKIIELLNLALTPEFRNRRFDGLDRPVLDTIFSLGTQSEENFKKVEASLLKFIEDHQDTLNDIDFLHVNIIRMKEQINLEISKNYTLHDALFEYAKLQ